ncbi:MAG: DUF2905 domain-containing protein [Nitrospirota bacterium]|jgi:hypothetical protein
MTDGLESIGKALLVAGVLFLVLGGLFILAGKVPWLGRLPGDILIKRKHFTFYFPLATSIVLSILLTLILWLLSRR